MKKTILFLAISLMGLSTLFAQNLHMGIDGGVAVGDSSETYTATAALNFSFLFDLNNTFKIGPSASFHHYIGKEIENENLEESSFYKNVTFIPVGLEVRAKLSQKIYLGGEVAYGLGFAPAEAGLFYKPFLGYQLSEKVSILGSFSRITSDTNNINAVNLGINILTF